MSSSRFEYPDGLGPKGRRLWDLYAAHFDSLPELDTVHLEVACNVVDMIDQLREHLRQKPNDSAAVTRYAIMLDKFMPISKSLGLTLTDRVNAKLVEAPAAVAKRMAEKKAKDVENGKAPQGRPKKTSLGELSPAALGIGV